MMVGYSEPDTHAGAVVGVLLAGGQSRRMGGGDKCLLTLGVQPMLAHVRDRLSPQTGTVILNANGDPERFSGFGLPVVADSIAGFAGPLAGVLAGLLWARDNVPDAAWIVTAASDTPFFPKDLVAAFIARPATAIRRPSYWRNRTVTCSRFSVSGRWRWQDDLHAWLARGESRKVLAWVDNHRSQRVAFGGPIVAGEEIDPFFNINTPGDMEQATALLQEEQE